MYDMHACSFCDTLTNRRLETWLLVMSKDSLNLKSTGAGIVERLPAMGLIIAGSASRVLKLLTPGMVSIQIQGVPSLRTACHKE